MTRFPLLFLLTGCIVLTLITWNGLNMWQHHNQQHATSEKQIQELQAYVNLLLQERAQRAR